jgi:hypothetical protein
MQCKMCVMNCVLFHVKSEHSHDCKSLMVLQSHMDILKDEPGSCDETSVTSSDDGSQVIGIKVEEDNDMKEEDGPELVTSPLTEAEHEVSHVT